MYILGHQGWTDFFSQFGLYIHFANLHKSLTVLVLDSSQMIFVRRLFMNTGIKVELIETTEHKGKTCVICHQQGNPIQCPRYGGKCKYPNLNIYKEIQGLCVFDDPEKWFQIYSESLKKGHSFVEAFYIYHGISPDNMYLSFNVVRTPQLELTIPILPYLVYHIQQHVRFPIEKLRKDLMHISLDRKCLDFFGCIGILQHAKEIHVIQSSYCMFIYLLQLKYDMFKNIPIFVYTSARSNSNTDYKNLNRHPQLSNWIFL
jgi:hypothetical protein